MIIWLAFAELLKVLWYIFLFDIKNGQFFSFVFGGPFKSGGILAKHKMWWKNCYHVCKVHALIFRLMKRENDGWIFLDEWKKNLFIMLYTGSLLNSSMFFACTARYFGACLHVRQNICEASSHVVEKFLQL